MSAANFTLGGKITGTDKPILRDQKKLLKYSKDQFEPSEPRLSKGKDRSLKIIMRMNWFCTSSPVSLWSLTAEMDSFYVIFFKPPGIFSSRSWGMSGEHRWPCLLRPSRGGEQLCSCLKLSLCPFSPSSRLLSGCPFQGSERRRWRWNYPEGNLGLPGWGGGGMEIVYDECQGREGHGASFNINEALFKYKRVTANKILFVWF